MRTIAVLDTPLRLCYGVQHNFGSLTATKTNRVLYIRDTSSDLLTSGSLTYPEHATYSVSYTSAALSLVSHSLYSILLLEYFLSILTFPLVLVYCLY